MYIYIYVYIYNGQVSSKIGWDGNHHPSSWGFNSPHIGWIVLWCCNLTTWHQIVGKIHGVSSRPQVFFCPRMSVASGKHTKSYWKWWFIVDLPLKLWFFIVMLVYQRVVVGTTVGLTDWNASPALESGDTTSWLSHLLWHQLWRFPKSWGFPQKSKSHRFSPHNWMFPNIGVIPPNHPFKYI